MAQDEFSFDEFLSSIAAEFGWEPKELTKDSLLTEDCGLDSLGMYELLLILEDLGHVIDEEELLEWETLGDAFSTCSSG
jgi:acyl carrier protein